MSDTTKRFLLGILRDDMNLDIDADRVTPQVPLGSSGLGLESLDFVQLIMEADRKLGVSIPEDETPKIASFTVGDLLDYLDQRLGPDDQGMTPGKLRDLLSANSGTGIAATVPVDKEFVLDSLQLTWVLHELKENWGLDADPEEPRLAGVTTLERIAGYVGEHQRPL